MKTGIVQTKEVRLSICITTFNRAAFIGETLESILSQLPEDCELVVLDSASTDATSEVLSSYEGRHSNLRFVRKETNKGFDEDCDSAVELARGEYCWLMTDDDVVKPGAIAAILGSINSSLSLILLNGEIVSFDMAKVLQHRWVEVASDRMYASSELDRLVTDHGHLLRFVGCVVIKRSIWMARDRRRYFGSMFIHLGVIFQELLPGKILLIAQPCFRYRMGNTHVYSSRSFETFVVKLLTLLESTSLSKEAKDRICSTESWTGFRELLELRGLGFYSKAEYVRWVRPRLTSVWHRFNPAFVALLPGGIVNLFYVIYYSLSRRLHRRGFSPEVVLQMMRESPYHFRSR